MTKSPKLMINHAMSHFGDFTMISPGHTLKNICLKTLITHWVLDAGGGTGLWSIKIVKYDITNMKEFKDNTFDLALAEGDPVSYCSNPDQAISELARVTKKRGYVTVSVDNKLVWLKRSIEKGDYKEAERIMKTGIAKMSTEDGNYYPAFTFTIEELSEIFKKTIWILLRKSGNQSSGHSKM
ncbi:MAG: class I SAM-dependent methyltransferase [Atribacterota bacterium]|nr:class I SAM-dependent methyltransferase [Atribacterota bacterium]